MRRITENYCAGRTKSKVKICEVCEHLKDNIYYIYTVPPTTNFAKPHKAKYLLLEKGSGVVAALFRE